MKDLTDHITRWKTSPRNITRTIGSYLVGFFENDAIALPTFVLTSCADDNLVTQRCLCSSWFKL